jgi:hypothetical protein
MVVVDASLHRATFGTYHSSSAQLSALWARSCSQITTFVTTELECRLVGLYVCKVLISGLLVGRVGRVIAREVVVIKSTCCIVDLLMWLWSPITIEGTWWQIELVLHY